MTRKLLLFALPALLFAAPLAAQDSFTDRLQKKEAGKGTVKLHHDAAIDNLVNGRTADAGQGAGTGSENGAQADKAKASVAGYRIQVYAGGNSGAARNEASRIGKQVKNLFADWGVYTQFRSPRWICRVGDFKTIEEANEGLRRLKEAGTFAEAVIVRSKIVVSY